MWILSLLTKRWSGEAIVCPCIHYLLVPLNPLREYCPHISRDALGFRKYVFLQQHDLIVLGSILKHALSAPFPSAGWLSASVNLAFLWGPTLVTHSSKHRRVRSSLVSALGKLSCHLDYGWVWWVSLGCLDIGGEELDLLFCGLLTWPSLILYSALWTWFLWD